MKMKLFLLGLMVGAGILAGYSIFAQTKADIVYPVKELGNCASEITCRAYCDKPQHASECISFAEEHGLISKEEAETAKKFVAIGKGPGGCTSKDSCETYCNDTSHLNECLTFAEQNNLMSSDQLAEAKKVQAALEKGAQMPGNCRSKKECDGYCENPDHMEECFAFAQAAGFMSPQEIEEARKVMPLMKQGQMPGGCRSKDQCEAYCKDESHFEECINFAEKAGFISKEDADMARKTGGKGPGGCKSKEECDQFCQNPTNQETCFNFAKEHGLISEADFKQMEEGQQKMKEALSNAPAQVMDCLSGELGSEAVEKLKTGSGMPTKEVGEKMRECFEKEMKEMGPPGNAPGGPPGQGGGAPNLENMPPQIQDCLRSTVGQEVLDQIKAGQMPSSLELGDKMRSCFEQFKPEEGSREGSSSREHMPLVGTQIPQPPEGMSPGPQGTIFPEGQIPNQEEIQRMEQQMRERVQEQVQQNALPGQPLQSSLEQPPVNPPPQEQPQVPFQQQPAPQVQQAQPQEQQPQAPAPQQAPPPPSTIQPQSRLQPRLSDPFVRFAAGLMFILLNPVK